MSPDGAATDASTEGDAGNVPAGGALPAATTSDSTDHPAMPHINALRLKLLSGEAMVLGALLAILDRIEEAL
jgi:hypothetical protein